MTVERDRALSRAAEWLDRAYLCITDARGNVELPDGVISQPPGACHVVRKEIGERFRELRLQLQDYVIPDVEAALPDSVEAFTELGERMHGLRFAIYEPWNEFVAAVGECRAAWREADQAIRRESEPKTNAERDDRGGISLPNWPPGRPSARDRIMAEHKRRIQIRKAHDEPEPSVLEEAEALQKLDELNFFNNDILTPAIRTIQDYIYEYRKSQKASPKTS